MAWRSGVLKRQKSSAVIRYSALPMTAMDHSRRVERGRATSGNLLLIFARAANRARGEFILLGVCSQLLLYCFGSPLADLGCRSSDSKRCCESRITSDADVLSHQLKADGHFAHVDERSFVRPGLRNQLDPDCAYPGELARPSGVQNSGVRVFTVSEVS